MKYKILYFIIEKMQYKKFGNYIRRKRRKLNIALNTFALDSGIDKASLSNFERNKSDIYFENFTKIAKGFNLTPAQLLTEFENQ